jgi:arginine exporter protein ArgO
MGDEPASVKIAALICLTVVVCFAIAGITAVSLVTDRDVHYAEGLTFGGAVFLALLGGVSFVGLRRRRARWRIEREENGDDDVS